MSHQVFGYLRVSTKDQHEDRQLAALSEYQIPAGNLYCDKQSGKDFDRPAYQRLLRRLRAGDLLIIKSIDRLGRNYSDILAQWRIISVEKKCNIKVIDMPLLDTSHSQDLTGTLIADIVLQLLSYVAQTEREFIRQRQAEGIAAAKVRGVRFGRPRIARPDQFREICLRWRQGEFSSRAAAQLLQVSQSTFLAWARQLEDAVNS